MPSDHKGDIVVVSPTPTHPHDFGNRKRIYRLTKGLQEQGYRIHFILYPLEDPWRKNFPEAEFRAMQEEWDEFHLVVPTVPYHKSPDGIDHRLDEWWDVGLEKFLWWYLRSRRFSAVLVNYIYLSRALTLAPKGTLRILDTHDRFGDRRNALAKLGLGPEFFHLSDLDEAQGLNRADVTIAIKDEEREHFSQISSSNCICVPHSDGMPRRRTPRNADDGYLRIGLIGGRNNINRRSVQSFLDLLIPRVFATGAPIKVVLAGSMCADLSGYTGKFCVETIGYLDDVSDFYDSIDVSVVPIDVSTGQKIKTAEALTFGVPLISHTHAFEGFQSDEPLHHCQSIGAIVEACIEISFDQSQLLHLARKSRQAAIHQEKVFASAVQTLSDLITKTPAAAIVVDAKRYQGDVALQHHIELVCNILALLSGTEVLFVGGSAKDLGHIDCRNAVAALQRQAVLKFVDTPDQVPARIGSQHRLLWLTTDLAELDVTLADWTGAVIRVPALTGLSGPEISRGIETALNGSVVIEDRRGTLASGPFRQAIQLFKGFSPSPKSYASLPKGRLVLVLLPEALPQRTRQAAIAVLEKFLTRGQQALVVSETGAAGNPTSSQNSRISHVTAADMDMHLLASKKLAAIDLSGNRPEFAFLSAQLECLPIPLYRPRQAEIFDGVRYDNSFSVRALVDWVMSLDTDNSPPARPVKEDGMSALYSLVRHLV